MLIFSCRVVQAEPIPKVSRDYSFNGTVLADDHIDNNDTFILKKTFIVSFYTDDWSENSGIEGVKGVNAYGEPLVEPHVACNKLPMKSYIYYGGKKRQIVDTGSQSDKHFGKLEVDYSANRIRVDQFVAKKEGESRREYLYRVNMMGKVEHEGYIIISRELAEELKGEPIITDKDYQEWLKTDEGQQAIPDWREVNNNYRRFLETGSYK